MTVDPSDLIESGSARYPARESENPRIGQADGENFCQRRWNRSCKEREQPAAAAVNVYTVGSDQRSGWSVVQSRVAALARLRAPSAHQLVVAATGGTAN